MERFYKIHDLNLYVSQTIKTMSFNVWRDVSRNCYQSTELSAPNGGYSIYRFATKSGLDKAVSVLNGALFKEATDEEWNSWQNSSDYPARTSSLYED